MLAYFSAGVEADIALKFHEIREAASKATSDRAKSKGIVQLVVDYMTRTWTDLFGQYEKLCTYGKIILRKIIEGRVSEIRANFGDLGDGSRRIRLPEDLRSI